jgi:hypothetical protein
MKIEEKDVFQLLNDELKDHLVIFMNGRYLKKLRFKD